MLLLLLPPGGRAEAAGLTGSEYLERIGTGIEYPAEDEYLAEFQFATVRAPSGHSVFGFGSADHAGRSFTVSDAEEVLVLAERRNYACVIVLSERKARWVNTEYLVNRYYANERAIDSAIGYVETDPIPLTAEYFPDDSFRRYLKVFDENADGTLSGSEQRKITAIDCYRLDIETVQGIEFFTQLQELSIDDNLISELDLSQNGRLQKLSCGRNRLTELDLSLNGRLRYVSCEHNMLTELNLSNSPQLKVLNCSRNSLPELDVRECENLSRAVREGEQETGTTGERRYTREEAKTVLCTDGSVEILN